MESTNLKNGFLEIDLDAQKPKYIQIIDSVTNAIKRGKLKRGDKIFSINELSNEYFLSRDTVQKAYDALAQRGIITAVKGKGFYINRSDLAAPYRVLLIFNKISNYKKQIYNAFIEKMRENAVVDLKIHHSNIKVFEGLLADHLHEYDYYVVMPHFYEHIEEACRLIRMIPPEKLLLLDKDMPQINKKYAAVFQDFKNDIVEALETGLVRLKKYAKLFLVHSKIIPYPAEISTGFRIFCMQNNFAGEIISEIAMETAITAGEAYIVIEETDLVNIIKICGTRNLKIGKDVGIISYNETPLKEILLDGISVVSTDHAKMGETAATLILENRKEKIKNPFTLILRKSL